MTTAITGQRRFCSHGHDQRRFGRLDHTGCRYCLKCRRDAWVQGAVVFAAPMDGAGGITELASALDAPVCGSFPLRAEPQEPPMPRLVLLGPWSPPKWPR